MICNHMGRHDGCVECAKRDLQEIAKKYEDRYFAARALLKDIVDQYNLASDGPLGKGFTNAPFIAAKKFLGDT